MDHKSLVIRVPREYRQLLRIQVTTTKDLTAKIQTNLEEHELLIQYKNKINIPKYQDRWDCYKKLSNPFELIHIPTNKRYNNQSIAYYIPLSRSFFKMWEILHDLSLLKDTAKPIITGHVAEGPGGFIEAVLLYRDKYYYSNCRHSNENVDQIFGITLKSTKKEIPGWRKFGYFLKRYTNVKICYGSDGTGDIYNVDNIVNFIERVGSGSCQLVTADGGFDYSIDFNHQEQLSYRMILTEIVIALSIQKISGSFVCKFFDTYTLFSIKLLWLLNCTYEEVVITKPYTSRPANSERYIVAKQFLGISSNYLNQLFSILQRWENIEVKRGYIQDIFGEMSQSLYLNVISTYNSYTTKKQLSNIIETLRLIDRDKSKQDISQIEFDQTLAAYYWCLKYAVSVNYKSVYLVGEKLKKVKETCLTL